MASLVPGRRAQPTLAVSFLALWCVAAWLITSHDAVRESIMGFVLREQTQYASGFSEKALRTVRRGQSERDVREALGPPLREQWSFGFDETQPCRDVDMAQDVVVWAAEPEACLELGISAGTSRVAVQDALGSPSGGCWQYTRNPGSGYFRDRVVCFHDGTVVNVFRQWSSRLLRE
jgi:hypothetical protein